MSILQSYFQYSSHLTLGVAQDALLLWEPKYWIRKYCLSGFRRYSVQPWHCQSNSLKGALPVENLWSLTISYRNRETKYIVKAELSCSSPGPRCATLKSLSTTECFRLQDGLAPSMEDNDDVKGCRFWQSFVKGFGGT